MGVAVAAVSADGDADAYTIAQVRAGIPALKTAYDGQTRVITGVDYGHGLASGHLGYAGHLAAYNGFNTYSAYSPFNAHYIGKREADSEAEPKADDDAYTSHSAPVNTYKGYLGGYTGYTGYSGLVGYSGLNTHYIGKREADSDADAYTIAQVYNGLPFANAVATGHAHNPGYVAYTSHSAPVHRYIGGYTGYTGYTGFNRLAGVYHY